MLGYQGELIIFWSHLACDRDVNSDCIRDPEVRGHIIPAIQALIDQGSSDPGHLPGLVFSSFRKPGEFACI